MEAIWFVVVPILAGAAAWLIIGYLRWGFKRLLIKTNRELDDIAKRFFFL